MTTPTHTPQDAIEARLRVALDERAASLVPSERPVPPIVWPEPEFAPSRGRRVSVLRRWAPLAAAAAVLAVAGSLVAPQLLRSTEVSPGAGPSGSMTNAQATTTATLTTTPRATFTAAPVPGGDPAWGSADLGGGARIPLPIAWSGVRSTQVDPELPSGQCFGPSAANPCAVLVAELDPTDVDPEGVWGRSGDPGVCRSGPVLSITTAEARVATVGGREAEYRRLTWTCTTFDLQPPVVQYVVPILPGWVIATRMPDDPAVASVFARMVSGLVLPPARAPLRLVDQGRVASVALSGNGVDIVLKRMSGSHVNSWRETGARANYHVPSALFAPGEAPTALVGQVLTVRTDGSTVTAVVIPGG